MAITLYGTSLSPYVRKVRMVLHQKSLNYTLVPVLPARPPADFKKISPMGKVPVLQVDDWFLPDSSGICAYLERIHPNPSVYSKNNEDYGRELWIEEYVDTQLSRSVIGILFENRIGPRYFNHMPDQEKLQKIKEKYLPQSLDYLQGQLGKDYYTSNALSVADCSVFSFLKTLELLEPGFVKKWGTLTRFYDAVLTAPAAKALEAEETKALKV